MTYLFTNVFVILDKIKNVNFMIFQQQMGRFLMIPSALVGIATLEKDSDTVGYLNLLKFAQSQNPFQYS